MKLLVIVLWLVASLPLGGCDQPATDPPLDLTRNVGVIHYAYASEQPPSKEAHRARAKGSLDDRIHIMKTVNAAPNWEAADRQVRAFIQEEGIEAERARRRVQTAGITMLRTHLLGADVDTDKAEALKFYTQALINAGSPEVRDIKTAIDRLEPYWSSEEVEAAVLATAENADTYVARSMGSGRVTSEQLAQALEASGAAPLSVFEAQIQRTAEELRAGFLVQLQAITVG